MIVSKCIFYFLSLESCSEMNSKIDVNELLNKVSSSKSNITIQRFSEAFSILKNCGIFTITQYIKLVKEI